MFVRFNAIEGDLVRDYSIPLYNDNEMPLFSGHPHKEIDIIAIQIVPETLIKDKSVWGAFDLDEEALTLQSRQNVGMYEGSLVYSLGFPMSLVSEIEAPICRLGCISRIMDAFILKNNYPIFLVDAQVFPGNSGGPIISRPDIIASNGAFHKTESKLIGILSSYIAYRETLYSRQTGKDRMIQEENSGLTVVHPVDRIKEVVELEWSQYRKPAG